MKPNDFNMLIQQSSRGKGGCFADGKEIEDKNSNCLIF